MTYFHKSYPDSQCIKIYYKRNVKVYARDAGGRESFLWADDDFMASVPIFRDAVQSLAQ